MGDGRRSALPLALLAAPRPKCAMSQIDHVREREAAARADRNAYLFVAVTVFAIVSIDALSQMTEHARGGDAIPMLAIWGGELTSLTLTVALFPTLLWFTRRVPMEPGGWRTWLPLYVLASLVFSLAHVTGMAALRKLIWPIFSDNAYVFSDDLIRDFIYEYRKDALAFVIYVVVIASSRNFEDQRRELEAVREDNRTKHRLTLKCGGRTMWVDADDVAWVKAASNYVEVRAGDRTLLARATLANVARQLADAGVPAARVHRSYVVNTNHVAETTPTGEDRKSVV